jgi:hypothetical protein
MLTQYSLYNFANQSDIDFLIVTEVRYDIVYADTMGPTDSGWRDMATGERIISNADVVTFHVTSETDLLALKLRFGVRLILQTHTSR